MANEERLLPHDEDVERQVLGAILLDKDAIGQVRPWLHPENFYKAKHSTILAAIMAISDRGEPINDLMVIHELRRREQLEEVGGASYLADLVAEVATAANIEYHAKIVLEHSKRRQVIHRAQEIQQKAYDPATDIDTTLDFSIARFSEQKSQGLGPLPRWTAQDLHEILPMTHWAWPGWLPRGYLTLLVGEQGSGKSLLALALSASLIRGDPWPDGAKSEGGGVVLWIDSEASQALLSERIYRWQLPPDKVVLPGGEDILADVRLGDSRFWTRIERTIEQEHPALVVLDSLFGGHRRVEDEELGNITHKFSEIARDQGITVLANHHLRKRGMLDGMEINLDRVRGSTTITQFARVVLALDKPDQTLERVRLSQIKNNLAKNPSPVGFSIRENGLIFGAAPQRPHIETQLDRAKDLLVASLSKGPRPQAEVKVEMEGGGISEKTAKRAKAELGIVARKETGTTSGRWLWGLPAKQRNEGAP